MEDVGPNFQSELFQSARKEAWDLLHQLQSFAQPGQQEKVLKEKCEDLAQSLGLEKWWHPIKVRFGKNTLKSFRDSSDESITLKEGDIFFFDIGPVFKEHEADVGQSFQLGNPSFKNPAEEVFEALKKYWSEDQLSGEALYNKACDLAKAKGLTFNLKMGGHRLSEFPHALHHKGALKDFSEAPTPERWILEVHLLDTKMERGYFFEDLL